MGSTEERDLDAELNALHKKHAAYVVGRNIHLLSGWLNSVYAIAQHEKCPWDWLATDQIFGTSHDSAPSDYFAEIDDALYRLVLAKEVDGSVLIELHRALDIAAELTESIAQYAGRNCRPELCELYWEAASNIARATELLEQLVPA